MLVSHGQDWIRKFVDIEGYGGKVQGVVPMGALYG